MGVDGVGGEGVLEVVGEHGSGYLHHQGDEGVSVGCEWECARVLGVGGRG